ncbi:hypothetical protein Poly24_06560 [Rosistilla carotiformis]|uniref:Uncharacterized protein n=1 Tax=Rosistilla carotiformis TaxID=2528017 RepID=A0A518JN27_9BACT|nr:hypothetical protein [Rosistilla carotiformis]QDV66966.1 hypothetical protein Poly24_06560 [Rosistilla carotiformis]
MTPKANDLVTQTPLDTQKAFHAIEHVIKAGFAALGASPKVTVGHQQKSKGRTVTSDRWTITVEFCEPDQQRNAIVGLLKKLAEHDPAARQYLFDMGEPTTYHV